MPIATSQVLLMSILAATIALFIWGRLRHDMVALAALLTCVAVGLVPSADAFAGFGHPAVITVACVLVLSSALQSTGAVDAIARTIKPGSHGPAVMIGGLASMAAVLSAFMNNIGALALLMPIAIQTARKLDLPPGRVLMPIGFASILGGMTTLIGTPPNLIVSGFRNETSGASFAMFDFTPVGLAIAVAGLIFIVSGGWRLVPARERRGVEGFETGAYLTEAYVPDGSKAAGMTLREIERALQEADAQVVGLVRDEMRIPAPNPYRDVRAGDILIVEAEPDVLATALSSLGLELEEDVSASPDGQAGENAMDDGTAGPAAVAGSARGLGDGDVVLMELAVRPQAELVGYSASDIRLRTRFGINLLAISREGRHAIARLRTTRFRDGDVLLMQGPPGAIREFASHYGCVPLASRDVRLPEPGKALTATAIMAVAVAGAAFGLVPAATAFAGGVLATVLFGIVPARRIYDAIDWSVIVLLAALIPVAGAMASSGTADLIARALLDGVAAGNAIVALTLILIVTMTLSDFMNNAATAAVMCPIAIGAATALGVNPDAFLMAVAVGASCAFLTPIGHQNNTLIVGPGGFRFGDYWPLGLPLEFIVVIVGVPMLLWVWPL